MSAWCYLWNTSWVLKRTLPLYLDVPKVRGLIEGDPIHGSCVICGIQSSQNQSTAFYRTGGTEISFKVNKETPHFFFSWPNWRPHLLRYMENMFWGILPWFHKLLNKGVPPSLDKPGKARPRIPSQGWNSRKPASVSVKPKIWWST